MRPGCAAAARSGPGRRRGHGTCRPSTASPRGTSGQSSRPSTPGRTPAHTSTNGCPVTSTCGVRDRRRPAATPWTRRRGGRRARRAARCGDGPNAGDGGDEVVDAVHRLDDDAELAQVVAPDVLEQLGVVAALDPDPAGGGDPAGSRGAAATEPDAVERRRAGVGDRRPAQRHRPALEQEPARLPREVALVLAAVAQRHRLDAPPHDVAAEPARPVLDDHARRRRRPRGRPRPPGVGDSSRMSRSYGTRPVRPRSPAGAGPATASRPG